VQPGVSCICAASPRDAAAVGTRPPRGRRAAAGSACGGRRRRRNIDVRWMRSRCWCGLRSPQMVGAWRMRALDPHTTPSNGPVSHSQLESRADNDGWLVWGTDVQQHSARMVCAIYTQNAPRCILVPPCIYIYIYIYYV
jgi:hypothetical protein